MSDTIEHKIQAEFDQLNPNPKLAKLRTEGIKAFEQLGLPGRKAEAWKYTPVRAAFTDELRFNTQAGQAEAIDTFNFLNAHKLVFVDGVWSAVLSDLKDESDQDVFIGSLQQAVDAEHPALAKHLNQYLQNDTEPLSALNTAFLQDGAIIYAPKNYALAHPVLLIYIGTEANQDALVQPRNLVVAESGSQVEIVEYTINAGFTNMATEIVVNDNALVDWYSLQTTNTDQNNINTLQVATGRNARFNSWNFNLGGKLVRNNINVDLNGEGGETHLNGLYYLAGTDHLDNHLYVSHNVPHCFSNQLYKGLLDDRSTGVFNGKVYVKQDAQKTNAFQSNKNILLSDNATINTKPELEIYADDVKCSHGATTGQMDEQMLFYLQARGLSKKLAMAILNQAFIGEVVSTVKNEPLKAWLTDLIEKRFTQTHER